MRSFLRVGMKGETVAATDTSLLAGAVSFLVCESVSRHSAILVRKFDNYKVKRIV